MINTTLIVIVVQVSLAATLTTYIHEYSNVAPDAANALAIDPLN